MSFDPSRIKMRFVQTYDDVVEFVEWLGLSRSALAIDTETGGFEWWHDELRLVQCGDLETAWVLPWPDWSGVLRDVLSKYDGRVVMHNAKFDERFLRLAGVQIPRSHIEDTRVLSTLVDSSGRHGLKYLGVKHVDARFGYMQGNLRKTMSKNKWTWGTVPNDLPTYWQYAALDAVITAHLWEKLAPTGVPMYRDVYELEMHADWVISDIESRGAHVDVEYCEASFDELTNYLREITKFIETTYNCGVNDRSIAARLISDGVTLTDKTASGQWQLTKEVLEAIDHPLAQDVLSRRRAQKMANTYFRNLINRNVDGILHPDINPIGAQTGRMTITQPALHQVPRGRKVRDAFTARDGNQLIDIDFDQQEQRLVAHFSEDPSMIEAFREADSGDTDFFTLMARRVFHDETLSKDDIRRGSLKTSAYATTYGGGPGAVAHGVFINYGLKWSFEQAEALIAEMDRACPKRKQWSKSVSREAESLDPPAVITAYGRRLVVPEDAVHASINYLVQGTAADVLKQKIIDLDNAGLSQYIVLPVHDELLFDVPTEDAEDVAKAAEDIMRETERFIVPLTCQARIGRTWGEIH